MSIEITKKNFSNIIFNSEKPVLLNFGSPEDESSRKQDMFLNLFSYEHPEIVIGNVNADKEPSLLSMYGISTIPSIKIFKKGKCTAAASGLQDKLHLSRLIAR